MVVSGILSLGRDIHIYLFHYRWIFCTTRKRPDHFPGQCAHHSLPSEAHLRACDKVGAFQAEKEPRCTSFVLKSVWRNELRKVVFFCLSFLGAQYFFSTWSASESVWSGFGEIPDCTLPPPSSVTVENRLHTRFTSFFECVTHSVSRRNKVGKWHVLWHSQLAVQFCSSQMRSWRWTLLGWFHSVTPRHEWCSKMSWLRIWSVGLLIHGRAAESRLRGLHWRLGYLVQHGKKQFKSFFRAGQIHHWHQWKSFTCKLQAKETKVSSRNLVTRWKGLVSVRDNFFKFSETVCVSAFPPPVQTFFSCGQRQPPTLDGKIKGLIFKTKNKASLRREHVHSWVKTFSSDWSWLFFFSRKVLLHASVKIQMILDCSTFFFTVDEEKRKI